jgi:hypothetical protein
MLVMAVTRALQLVQSKVFHVLPFGALSNVSLLDICVGIFVSGVFMLYFGACHLLDAVPWLRVSLCALVVCHSLDTVVSTSPSLLLCCCCLALTISA